MGGGVGCENTTGKIESLAKIKHYWLNGNEDVLYNGTIEND